MLDKKSSQIITETLELLKPCEAVYFRGIAKRDSLPYSYLQTFIVCRENSQKIQSWPNPCPIKTRGGILQQDKCVVVITIFSFPGVIYEIYWNYFAKNEQIFDDMTVQDNITFRLYGDALTCERTILYPNSLKQFFKIAISIAKKSHPWSMHEFDIAKEKIYQKYTCEQLWELFKDSSY